MRKAMVVLAGAAILGSGWAARAQDTAADLLAKARSAYEQRSSPVQAKQAAELYAQAAKAGPQAYDAFWEGARACYYEGHYALKDAPDKELLALYQDGIDRAKAAVALDPKGVEGHFWLGVLYGVYGETKGIFKSLAMVPGIKQEMQTCMELDPSVEGYGPGRVLGRLYFKLPGFKGGDNKKSIQYLEASLKGAPTNALTKLYLAETYKDEGMKEKAMEQLKAIISMTPDPRWAPEHTVIKAEALRLLDKWS